MPVHVGTGEIECSFREEYDHCYCVRKHFRKNGYLMIPGSTIKGVLSTYFLALFKDIYQVSILFGAPGYQSRVIVDDFVSESKNRAVYRRSPRQWRPRRGVPGSIKLYKPLNRYGDLEEILCLECIPEDTRVKGKITVLNSSDEEVAKIVLTLGYTPASHTSQSHSVGYLMIGYGKGKGFGKVRLVSLNIVKYSSQDYFASGTNVTDDVIGKAESLFAKIKNAWNEVFKE